MGKLTPPQVEEYFDKHLPYRTGILLAHYRMTRGPWTGDPGMLNACFVSALVTGRLFLNVLGVGKKKGKGGYVLDRYSPRPTDVTVDDLGGVLIDPATLPKAERDLFLHFLIMADQAAAHFTVPISHEAPKPMMRFSEYITI
jgi:hypothetical protein